MIFSSLEKKIGFVNFTSVVPVSRRKYVVALCLTCRKVVVPVERRRGVEVFQHEHELTHLFFEYEDIRKMYVEGKSEDWMVQVKEMWETYELPESNFEPLIELYLER